MTKITTPEDILKHNKSLCITNEEGAQKVIEQIFANANVAAEKNRPFRRTRVRLSEEEGLCLKKTTAKEIKALLLVKFPSVDIKGISLFMRDPTGNEFHFYEFILEFD